MTELEYQRQAAELKDACIRLIPQLADKAPSVRLLEHAHSLLRSGLVVEPTKRNDGVPRYLFCGGEWNDQADTGWPWCAAYVCWLHRMALVPIVANAKNERLLWECAAMWRCAVGLGVTEPAGVVPGLGWTMFLHGRGCSDRLTGTGIHHVGVVSAIDGGRFCCIEGNAGNRLAEVWHNCSDNNLAGFARFVAA